MTNWAVASATKASQLAFFVVGVTLVVSVIRRLVLSAMLSLRAHRPGVTRNVDQMGSVTHQDAFLQPRQRTVANADSGDKGQPWPYHDSEFVVASRDVLDERMTTMLAVLSRFNPRIALH